MGGEHGAAHADDAGLVDDVDDVLGGQVVGGFPRRDIRAQGFQIIVADDDGRHHRTAHMGPRLNGDDLAGDGGMNGTTESGVVADLLTDGDLVPLFDQGLTGRTDVLGHGDHDRFRRGEGLGCSFTGKGFHIIGVDTAEERKRHLKSPLAKSG